MTVAAQATETKINLTAANLGPFSTVWYYEQASDVRVLLDAGAGLNILTNGSDYTLAATDPLNAGGTVTLSGGLLTTAAWPPNSYLVLQRVVAADQPSGYGQTPGFSPLTSEQALDHVVRRVQQMATADGRALRLPPGDSLPALPDAVARANTTLAFDASGNLVTLPSSTPVSSYVWASRAGLAAGVADNGAVLNALILALEASGGGKIVFEAPGGYPFTTPINLRDKVSIDFIAGAYLLYTGGTGSGPLISTSLAQVTRNIDSLIAVDSGAWNDVVVQINSSYFCKWEVEHRGGATTCTSLVVSALSTGGGTANSKRNNAANRYRLRSNVSTSKGLVTVGMDAGGGTYDGTPQKVTLNTFENIVGYNVLNRGIELQSHTDSNHWSGMTRFGVFGAANGIGLQVGSVDGASCYNNVWDHLAIDTFSTGTNRRGLRFEANSKQNEVRFFYQVPVAEGGQTSYDAACASYRVALVIADGTIEVQAKNWLPQATGAFSANITAGSWNRGGGGGHTDATTKVTIGGWTEEFDTLSAFNPTTGVYTAPVSGYYQFSFSLLHDATINVGDRFGIYLQTTSSQKYISYSPPAAVADTAQCTWLISLNAGDTAQLQIAALPSVTGVFAIVNDTHANQFAGVLVRTK